MANKDRQPRASSPNASMPHDSVRKPMAENWNRTCITAAASLPALQICGAGAQGHSSTHHHTDGDNKVRHRETRSVKGKAQAPLYFPWWHTRQSTEFHGAPGEPHDKESMEIVTRDPTSGMELQNPYWAALHLMAAHSAQGLMLEVDVADGCRHEKYASITLQQLARWWRNVCTGGGGRQA